MHFFYTIIKISTKKGVKGIHFSNHSLMITNFHLRLSIINVLHCVAVPVEISCV